MGIMGTEGVFRRCCECETMKVLRANHHALLTILHVFLHDPLYKWAISPIKAQQLQTVINDDTDEYADDVGDVVPPLTVTCRSDGAERNADAERAIFRVKSKLQGLEYGEPLSIEGQVNQLIIEARNPPNLERLFAGWMPFC